MSEDVVPYEQAWAWQKQLVARACAAAQDADQTHDALLLLQHQPVYTLGAGSTEAHLRFPLEDSPLPLHRVERGGEVTHHGPGQLVLYPILNLRYHRQDLHWYLRSLEEVVIRALQRVSGLQGERLEGLTGVWLEGRKVAAIGVRARQWITYHGLALNVDMDLTPFQDIVPCGISDREVTSVQQELGRFGGRSLAKKVTPREKAQLRQEYSHALLEAFEEIFSMSLVVVDGKPDVDDPTV